MESWSSHIERLIDIIDNLHVCTLKSHSGVLYVGYSGVVMISLTIIDDYCQLGSLPQSSEPEVEWQL